MTIDTSAFGFSEGFILGVCFILFIVTICVIGATMFTGAMAITSALPPPPPPPLSLPPPLPSSIKEKEPRYITHEELAEALDCFWNAAMVAANRDNGIGTEVIGLMAEGIAAISTRLKEIGETYETGTRKSKTLS